MELVAVLRLLWRRRLLVALVAITAVVVALAVSYRIGFPPKLENRYYAVGIGAASALVDTPHSQVVDLGGDTGTDLATLSARASLLASLMASSPIKDEIAEKAGILPQQLQTSAPDATTGDPGASTKGNHNAYIMKSAVANLESGQIPIISVKTQAPDAGQAAALADASISVLQAQITSTAGTDKVPVGRRVVVRQLGPAHAGTVSRGPSPSVGILIGVLIFLGGCGAIVGISALVRGWRQAVELEMMAAGPAPAEHEEDEAEVEDDVPSLFDGSRLAPVQDDHDRDAEHAGPAVLTPWPRREA